MTTHYKKHELVMIGRNGVIVPKMFK